MDWYSDFVARLTACQKCPRLAAYRSTVKPLKKYSGQPYWARPVPPWGDLKARVMVVGLAPAAHGGNRTGRMFTGDRSAQNLFKALHLLGLSTRPYSISKDDGVELRCVYITSAVKCAPPRNRPTQSEVENCVAWLREEIEAVKPRAVVALGAVAWGAVLRALGAAAVEFRHGAAVDLGWVKIYASYHPSPRNMNTGRLSAEELAEVLKRAAAEAGCI
ncbi:uracil-DNA glycosylase [Pyrobaculum sp.]|uniref:uracil-DNA glycosylase n=1 Tax=Pyrobaculum sp. TaxID=2004705 RepID=UPI003D0B9354